MNRYFDLRFLTSKIKWLICIFILAPIFIQDVFPQDQAVCDSLIRLLQNPLNDTMRVDVLSGLCWEYKDNDPDKAFRFGQSGLDLAENVNYQAGRATCLKNIGLIHYHQGNYLKSIEFYQKSLKIYLGLKNGKGISACYNDLGLIYYAQGNYNLAEKYYNDAYKILQPIIDQRRDVNLRRACMIASAHALNNIGMVSYQRHDHKKAREYLMKALELYKNTGFEIGYASVYDQLGKDYEDADASISIHYYQTALQINKKIKYSSGICDVLGDISDHYNSRKDFRNAIDYSRQCLDLSIGIQYLESQRKAYKNLSIAYEGVNDIKTAFVYYKLYKTISDSIFNEAKQKQSTYIEIMLETEKKQNEIELLNRDNKLQETEINRQRTQQKGLLIGVFLTLLLAFVIFWNYFRIRKTLAIVENQKRKIEESNIKLGELASLIQIQKDELEKSNKILSDHEIELQLKNEELESQNEEMNTTMEELRNAQAQLIESEKMASLGVLSAGIAHEINNPVNFISSGIEGLKPVLEELWLRIPDNNEAMELLKKDYSIIISNIDEGITRTVNVIKSLLMFTRAEQNILKLVNNLNENIDSTLILLASQYKNRINIVKKYGSIPGINCYPGKLNQVFMNILSNAVQAIPATGTITIETRRSNGPYNNSDKAISPGNRDEASGKFIRISIQDTGEGISEGIRERIFEPFFTTKEAGKGTGLGLSISYSLVKEHKGFIQFTSKIGEGTCFNIYLPLNPE